LFGSTKRLYEFETAGENATTSGLLLNGVNREQQEIDHKFQCNPIPKPMTGYQTVTSDSIFGAAFMAGKPFAVYVYNDKTHKR
jgi:hypothetical protein